ncbi:hypothetical protein EDX97_08200 [Absicoccus porci]|uniref:Uncharacterized protein n=1 Tax=Absicoccus porci TaxID=2486576 RepID=A0A3N0HZV7_9FIRM|nr:hypothetical protein EDX97_08200 [Absicoccus porci]
MQTELLTFTKTFYAISVFPYILLGYWKKEKNEHCKIPSINHFMPIQKNPLQGITLPISYNRQSFIPLIVLFSRNKK